LQGVEGAINGIYFLAQDGNAEAWDTMNLKTAVEAIRIA
jgi:hypothetical protein